MYIVMRSPCLMEDGYEFNGAFDTYAEAAAQVKSLTADRYWKESNFLIFEEPSMRRRENIS